MSEQATAVNKQSRRGSRAAAATHKLRKSGNGVCHVETLGDKATGIIGSEYECRKRAAWLGHVLQN